MIDIYVGIDPSINSTGMTVLTYEDNVLLSEHFYIIKPDKLTKKEAAAEEKHAAIFEYVLYEKFVNNEDKDNNSLTELCKTKNFMNILYKVKDILLKCKLKYNNNCYVHVCQEGISYGSTTKTRAVFDLAGLNFMLRYVVVKMGEELIIGTPGEIKKFASGNGNCKKDVMIGLFGAIHRELDLPKLDDIADSYWMAKYAKYINDKNDKN